MAFAIGNIILGLVGIVIGVLIIKEAFRLNHHFYFLDFIERRFGGGSGTIAYRIIGLLVCIFSIFIMVGIIDPSGQNVDSVQNQQNNQNQITIPLPNNNGINIAP